jgi:hypothetical protein
VTESVGRDIEAALTVHIADSKIVLTYKHPSMCGCAYRWTLGFSGFCCLRQNCQPHVSLRRSSFDRTGDNLDLCNTVAVSQHNTNLGGSGAFSCELADVVDNGFGRGLEPGGNGAGVWDRRSADTFALAVKTTHVCGGGGVDFVVCMFAMALGYRRWFFGCGVGGGCAKMPRQSSRPRFSRTISTCLHFFFDEHDSFFTTCSLPLHKVWNYEANMSRAK